MIFFRNVTLRGDFFNFRGERGRMKNKRLELGTKRMNTEAGMKTKEPRTDT